MKGVDALWQPGTDHAGIATQIVVEKQLASENRSRHDLGREAFVERVWAWKKESGGTITRQLRRLGTSPDWAKERFTLDAGLSAAVTKVFVDLHAAGLIYRDKRLVNWDCELATAISDLEVVQRETAGHLWHFRYPLEDGSGHIIIATTRPETMLGDTAVAVHPEDARYRHLVGKNVVLPIANRTIPIVADEYADPEMGSGALKITPAHDFNDFEVGRRHQLPRVNVFDAHAHLNEAAPATYRGLDRLKARQKVVAEMESLGLLEKVEDHAHTIPYGDRSGTVIEPRLTDQWFVDAAKLAGPAIEAVEKGRNPFRAEALGEHLFRMDAQHPVLVHLAANLVGASDSGLVRARWRDLRRRHGKTSNGRGDGPLRKGNGAHARSGRAGHVVFRPPFGRSRRWAGRRRRQSSSATTQPTC